MLSNVLVSKDYKDLLHEIKSRIVVSRIKASQSLNKELIRLYWDIGQSIVERQAKHKWGQRVVELLSNDLKSEFENFRGFSPDNLWRMRMFYLEYRDYPKLAQLVPEIPWGHNVLIMQKVKSRKEKDITFGIILCAQKKNIVVEYALKSAKNPVGVAEYKLTKKLPVALKRVLPGEEDLIAQVRGEMQEG